MDKSYPLRRNMFSQNNSFDNQMGGSFLGLGNNDTATSATTPDSEQQQPSRMSSWSSSIQSRVPSLNTDETQQKLNDASNRFISLFPDDVKEEIRQNLKSIQTKFPTQAEASARLNKEFDATKSRLERERDATRARLETGQDAANARLDQGRTYATEQFNKAKMSTSEFLKNVNSFTPATQADIERVMTDVRTNSNNVEASIRQALNNAKDPKTREQVRDVLQKIFDDVFEKKPDLRTTTNAALTRVYNDVSSLGQDARNAALNISNDASSMGQDARNALRRLRNNYQSKLSPRAKESLDTAIDNLQNNAARAKDSLVELFQSVPELDGEKIRRDMTAAMNDDVMRKKMVEDAWTKMLKQNPGSGEVLRNPMQEINLTETGSTERMPSSLDKFGQTLNQLSQNAYNWITSWSKPNINKVNAALATSGMALASAKGPKGRTIFHYVGMYAPNPLSEENKQLIRIMIQNACGKYNNTSACLDVRDNLGNTALHYAFENNNEDLMRLLISSGASQGIANNDGDKIMLDETNPEANNLTQTNKNSILDNMNKQASVAQTGGYSVGSPLDQHLLNAMEQETEHGASFGFSSKHNMHGGYGNTNSEKKHIDGLIKMFDMEISSTAPQSGGRKVQSMMFDHDSDSEANNNSYMKISNQEGGKKLQGSRKNYYNLSSLLDSEYGFSRSFEEEAEKLHQDTIETIKTLLKVGEDDARIYKAALWKRAKDEAQKRKDKGERVDNIAKSKIMFEMATKKILDKIKGKEFDDIKDIIEANKKSKEARDKNRDSNTETDTPVKKARKSKTTKEAKKSRKSKY